MKELKLSKIAEQRLEEDYIEGQVAVIKHIMMNINQSETAIARENSLIETWKKNIRMIESGTLKIGVDDECYYCNDLNIKLKR